jgi:hypothetical protein
MRPFYVTPFNGAVAQYAAKQKCFGQKLEYVSNQQFLLPLILPK